MEQTDENERPLQASLTGLSQERLKQLLDYDIVTGIFTWKISRGRCKAGTAAGTEGNHGYIQIQIGGTIYLAHHLAWFYVHGEWHRIDHKDTITVHNFLSNLRPTTQTQNRQNTALRINNMLGVKGVSQAPSGNYYARIKVNGQLICLGTFKTLGEASNARQVAAKKYFGEFCHEDEWTSKEETRIVD